MMMSYEMYEDFKETTHPPNPLPTHSPFLAMAFPCTGTYKVCKSNGPLFAVMAD